MALARCDRPGTRGVVLSVVAVVVLALAGVGCGDDAEPAPTGPATATGPTVPTGATSATGASGPSGATGASGSTGVVSVDFSIPVRAGEMFFDPRAISVPEGSTVEIAMTNEGLVEHDFVLDEVQFRLYTAAGDSASDTFVVPPAGTYTFYCSIPGHREAGMVGTLTVNPA
jgi:nitrite reductase (NO-forming)